MKRYTYNVVSKHFLGVFAKLPKVTISFVMSVCPYGISRLSWNKFLWNLIFWYFSKICRDNWSFFTIWKEKWVLYMKVNIHFWSYLVHFFSEWEIFQTEVVEKLKTHSLCSRTYFYENRAIYEIIWKNRVLSNRPQMII